VFEADKTAFNHLVQPLQPDRRLHNHLVFGGKTIAPKRRVKILGVTLDSKLSMNEHVSKTMAKASVSVWRCERSAVFGRRRCAKCNL
jgi:hypothetical protein